MCCIVDAIYRLDRSYTLQNPSIWTWSLSATYPFSRSDRTWYLYDIYMIASRATRDLCITPLTYDREINSQQNPQIYPLNTSTTSGRVVCLRVRNKKRVANTPQQRCGVVTSHPHIKAPSKLLQLLFNTPRRCGRCRAVSCFFSVVSDVWWNGTLWCLLAVHS